MRTQADIQVPIKIRRISRNDVTEVASLHREIFPDYFLSRMGQRFLELFYRQFGNETGNCGYAAESGGEFIGLVVGTSNPSCLFNRFYRENFKELALITAARLLQDRSIRPSLYQRKAHFGYALKSLVSKKEPAESVHGLNKFDLMAIGVKPEFRGTGLAENLLERFCGQVRAEGAAMINLSVFQSNSRAIAFYKKCGWQLIRETSTGFAFSLLLDSPV